VQEVKAAVGEDDLNVCPRLPGTEGAASFDRGGEINNLALFHRLPPFVRYQKNLSNLLQDPRARGIFAVAAGPVLN